MRALIGISVGMASCLALAACDKPAPKPVVPTQAPAEPKIRIAKVGGTVFVATVTGPGTVTARPSEAMPGPAVASPATGTAPANGYTLNVPLPAADAARVTLGATAQVRFAAFENDVIVGRVTRIGPPTDGKSALEIVLPRDARLRAKQEGTARIAAKGAGTVALLVPPSAVVGPHPGTATVFVVDLATSRLHLRSVTLGEQTPDGISVTAGLQPGEWVALTRTDQLKDGMKIAPIGPDS